MRFAVLPSPILSVLALSLGLAVWVGAPAARVLRDCERAIGISGASGSRWWQERLQNSGRYAGVVDGLYNPETRAALVACATDQEC